MNESQKKELIWQSLRTKQGVVSDKLLDQITAISDEAYFPKFNLILAAEQPQNYLYLIISGVARSFSLDADGLDATKLFVTKEDYLIGESLFSDTSYEGFEDLTDLRCLRLEASAFHKIILSDEVLMRLYIGILEDTLRYKMRREYQFQSMSAAERYQNFLTEYPQLEAYVPQRTVASYIGVTKESLSRLRKKFS